MGQNVSKSRLLQLHFFMVSSTRVEKERKKERKKEISYNFVDASQVEKTMNRKFFQFFFIHSSNHVELVDE